jgi:hypothetical protein
MSEVPVTSYQLDAAAFEASVKPRLLRGLYIRMSLMAAAMVFGLVLVSLVQPNQGAPWPLIVAMFAMFAFLFARVRRNQLDAAKLAWHSYQLSISPDAMRRFVADLLPVEIVRPDVTPGDPPTADDLERELEALRAVQPPAPLQPSVGNIVKRRVLRAVIVWMVLVVALLALWQILVPGVSRP